MLPSSPLPLPAPAPPAPSSPAPELTAAPEAALRVHRATPHPPTEALTDLDARLRIAAERGDTAEVTSLLAQGVAVDGPDADGNTPLMKSILAGRPDTAALLRRYGASLDRKNRSGVTARDMAKMKNDPGLDRAIGLDP